MSWGRPTANDLQTVPLVVSFAGCSSRYDRSTVALPGSISGTRFQCRNIINYWYKASLVAGSL